MNYRHIASSVFALGAMVASAQAFAADSVYGGGATFPSLYYRQVFDCLYNPVGTDTSPPSVTCPHNAAVTFFYTSQGSGPGRTSWRSNTDSFTVPVTPPDPGPRPYPDISFAGSDAEVTAADLAAYDATHWGHPKQVPMLIGAVTMIFNSGPGSSNGHTDAFHHPAGQANPTGASSKTTISNAAVCGIFTGTISKWNDSALDATNGNSNLVSGSDPDIVVAIRTGGSGTTEILSRHLNAACAGYTGGISDTCDVVFAQLLNNNGALSGQTCASHPLNPRIHVVSGSQGIRSEVQTFAFSLGYVSSDFAKQVKNGSGAVLAGGDASATSVVAANLVNHAGRIVAPTIVATTAIVGSTPAPNPANDDPSNWGQAPGSADPTALGAYPIGGFTFMLTYTCYNPADGHDNGAALRLRNFFHAYFNTSAGKIKQILTLDGFAPLPTAWRNALNKMLTVNAGTKLANAGAAGACAAVSGGA
jgi:ABC-type phosphate transport system substrate-binding protein